MDEQPLRVAFVNWTRRRAGGVESFIASASLQLRRAGHFVALVSQWDRPQDRAPIGTFEGDEFCLETLGEARAWEAISAWRPDVFYVHSVLPEEVEARFLQAAPAVLSVHDYTRTCISGAKSFATPFARPCSRPLGPACLIHYFPRRCGGLSPFTLAKLYKEKTGQLRGVLKYRSVATHSEYMRQELLRQGVPSAVVPLAPFVRPSHATGASRRLGGPSHLLFVGRFERLKGGHLLLDALPQVSRAIARPLTVTFAGEGSLRGAWEQKARKLCQSHSGIEVKFAGWLSDDALDRCFKSADLLVLPSVWPEPFGMVGLEAGAHGVPATAFAVGGIPEWLREGVNGTLAPGDSLNAGELADALVRALRDPLFHHQLSQGALHVSQTLMSIPGVKALEQVLRG